MKKAIGVYLLASLTLVVVLALGVVAFIPGMEFNPGYGIPDYSHFLGVEDSDFDGVPNSEDACPGTPLNADVDSDGCDQTEFCRPFGCFGCFEADWKNDEPNSTEPNDCTVIISSAFQNGRVYRPECVPVICEDPEEPPVPEYKLTQMVPEGNVTVWLRSGTDSYFNTTLYDVPAMPENMSQINNTSYEGWCLESQVSVSTTHPYNATLISSYDPDLTIKCPECGNFSLDLVNYVLNHIPENATAEQVQEAIWYIAERLGGGPPADPVSLAIVNDAFANGEGFRPRPGQFFAVIVFINNANQLTIIAVDP